MSKKQTWLNLGNALSWIIEKDSNRLIQKQILIGYHTNGYLTFFLDNKKDYNNPVEHPTYPISLAGIETLIEDSCKNDSILPEDAKSDFLNDRDTMIKRIASVIPQYILDDKPELDKLATEYEIELELGEKNKSKNKKNNSSFQP